MMPEMMKRLYLTAIIGCVMGAMLWLLPASPPAMPPFEQMKSASYARREDPALNSQTIPSRQAMWKGRTPDATADLIVPYGAFCLSGENTVGVGDSYVFNRYSGFVTNCSPYAYTVVVKGRFLDRDQRPVGTGTLMTETLRPGETWTFKFHFPAEARSMDQIEIHGVRRTSAAAVFLRKVAVVLVFTLVGFATHVAISGHLNMKGWERRFLQRLRMV